MAENPALPLWTDALLGDTQHLSQAEFGAYMLMLIVAWRSKDCCLPDDDKYLAKITRSGANWKRMKPVVMAFWRRGEDGQLRQKRLSYEHLAVAEMRKQQSEAGKSSARKRKERLLATVEASLQREGNGKSTPISNPISISNEPLPQPSSSPPQRPEPRRGGDAGLMAKAGALHARLEQSLNLATPVILAPIVSWMQAGATPELIEAAIADVLSRKSPGWKPDGIIYFDKAVRRAITDGAPVARPKNGAVPLAVQSKDQADEVERINAQFIAGGSYQSDVSLTQVRAMIDKGLLTNDAARKAGYAL